MKITKMAWWWLPAFLAAACTPQLPPDEQEDQDILAYVQNDARLRDAVKTESGIYYVVTDQTQGAYPEEDDIVWVEYKGTLLDGTVFDSTRVDSTGKADYLEFILGRGQTVKGFDQSVRYLREGERGIFVFPSRLGYGSKGNRVIPPNTPLRFELYLRKIL